MLRLDFMLFPYFAYIEHFTKLTRGSFLFKEKFLLMEKSKSEESRRWKKKKNKKKKKKKRPKKKERVPICQEKKKDFLCESDSYWRSSVQILNKEVAVKSKFTIHNVKNQVSFSSYQPWYKKINTNLESQFWKLYVDSLFCSSAQFAVFPFLPRVFPSPLGTLLIIVSSSLTLHLVIEIKTKKTCLQWVSFPEKSWSIVSDARRSRCPIGLRFQEAR